MSAYLDPAGTGEYLTGPGKRIALAAFVVITTVGVIEVAPEHPSAIADAVAAAAAVSAAALLLQGWRPRLIYAAVATAGIAVFANAAANNIGWFAVCLLAGWCAVTGNRLDGLTYWAGATSLFAVEWLWVQPNLGWGAWLGGTTLATVFGLLAKHERDLVMQLRKAQAGLAEQARTQERNRIARELHDAIGHTLTVSLLHVQSALLAVEHDPADAARALAEAERLGRECLAEVRMTVGMLRADGGEAAGHGTAPLPGIDRLPTLVERFRSAGADITLTVEGETARMPAVTGLAVYRIVQEALTNAVKHAPGSPTAVRLTVGTSTVTLTADSPAVPGTGTGLGVASMRERAESLGGSCKAGPGGQGWLVRATLPLDVTSRAARAETAP